MACICISAKLRDQLKNKVVGATSEVQVVQIVNAV